MIYMDNAATTYVKKEVLEAMLPYYGEKYGNPSSIYEFGAENKKAVDNARSIIAKTINADDNEIYFTSGGTEADNWALRNAAQNYKDKGKHIITSKIEHHAIMNTCKYLEQKGFEITYLNVDEYGMINRYELLKSIRDDTILISIMFANNEIGTIEPVCEIGQIARNKGVLFHTDAVQAYCHVPIDVKKLNIDMLSASSHKIHGPKGIGFLYVRDGIKLSPLMFGGGQERHMRAGTENVPGIVGMAKAAQVEHKHLPENMHKQARVRDYLVGRILSEIPFSRLNGSRTKRLPGNASFSFQFVDGNSLLVMLDMEGICASSGSACTASEASLSHVLKAMGVPESVAYGTLRLTVSAETTFEEVDKTVEAVKKIVFELRKKSDEYKMITKRNCWR